MSKRIMMRYTKQCVVPPQAGSRQQGMTLLEAVISALVIAVGLLGLAGLQLNGMRYSHSANSLSVATQLAEEMAERVRANLTSVSDYPSAGTTWHGKSCGLTGEVASNCPASLDANNNAIVAPCFGGCASGVDIQDADVDAVLRKMCSLMPCGSEATLACDTSGVFDQCTVTITWADVEALDKNDTDLAEAKSLRLDFSPISPFQ